MDYEIRFSQGGHAHTKAKREHRQGTSKTAIFVRPIIPTARHEMTKAGFYHSQIARKTKSPTTYYVLVSNQFQDNIVTLGLGLRRGL